ncbi:MAG TPA: hypothetical protein EYP49_10925 [Anaerolineae bacterium]|nr:hypothetical protein [Anaerolineae bacterium]
MDHEVTLAPHELPMSIAGLFPEYRFESMDAETHESVIIERILERGTWFEDAEPQPMPEMLTPVEWSEVKRYCEDAAVRLVRRLLKR